MGCDAPRVCNGTKFTAYIVQQIPHGHMARWDPIRVTRMGLSYDMLSIFHTMSTMSSKMSELLTGGVADGDLRLVLNITSWGSATRKTMSCGERLQPNSRACEATRNRGPMP